MPTFGDFDPDVQYEDRIAAYAVIFQGGAIATVMNSRGGYFLPGGGTLTEETPEHTVLREIREELGREGRITCRLGKAVQFFFAVNDDIYYRMQATFFVVELVGESNNSGTLGEEQLCWLLPRDVQEKLFHSCHSWAVEQAVLQEESSEL
jgi:8-oxo-dGTP pyrophosphatase MutT (NUDIX family)